MRPILMLLGLFLLTGVWAQEPAKWQGKFEQLDQLLPTPNEYRSGAGTPGPKYWQQRADYKIDAEIIEAENKLVGKETITYYNNSPDNLKYVWIQLDQNVNKKENEDFGNVFGSVRDSIPTLQAQYLLRPIDFPAGYSIKTVTDKNNKPLQVTVNNTMMRIDLPTVLKSGENISFNIEWSYPITDRSMFLLSREGYEHFPDGNNVYLIAHWFPRMCQYDDYVGWQNKQFQRLGEFALEFGDYTVNLTVPADHAVAGTGTLVNAKDVLTSTQFQRLEKAKNTFDKPVMIITPEEAKEIEQKSSKKKKTWKFEAKNVRDVAFASSRKFIWDAQAVKLPTNTVLAMSFYPNEGMPVWSEESTKAVINALEVYSKFTFDYPYPVAISVNTSNIGMEFPMISFNGGRPNSKGQMSDRGKAGMIGVIVHEVGHNYFPMIVSSDERQWMWMDEGLNTFLQTMTEAERYPNYHHTTPQDIVPYMKGEKSIMRPIMTGSDNEQIYSFGANFYEKPTVALEILRETVMGRELFDKAFKEYANTWMYKHPRPADFFRIMEDASAVDLDWFWRGWFFSTDHVDMEVSNVKWFRMRTEKSDVESKGKKVKGGDLGASAGNKNPNDFSSGPEEFSVVNTPDRFYGEFLNRIDDNAVRKKLEGKNLYEVTFKNNGGLVMPLVIEWTYKDGSKEIERIPAEIWRTNESEVSKVFVKDKEVTNVLLDPNLELADVNMSDNVFPKKPSESKFDQKKKN